MKRNIRTVSLTPGNEWDGEPVLKFLEYRDGVLLKVRVRVGRYIGGGGRSRAGCMRRSRPSSAGPRGRGLAAGGCTQVAGAR